MTTRHFHHKDLDYPPLDAQSGRGKMHQLFGDQVDDIIEELNGGLVS